MAMLDAIARFVTATLLAGLWQAPIFAFAGWLVLRVQSRANATTRHSVLAVALFASLVLPIVTAVVAVRQTPIASRVSAAARVVRHAPSDVRLQDAAVRSDTVRPDENAPVARESRLPSFARISLALPRPVGIAILGLWLAGALFVLARLTVALVHLERLKRDALPLAIEYREKLTRWSAAVKGTRAVRLCDSSEIDIPIAVGLFDAMILVPKHLLEELSPQQIDSIVLHELAHLRRADDWFNAVERVSGALLYFNPAIAWLCAQLDLEREVACDDWVLQQDDALPYATCLAKVAETAIWPRRPMTAPGAFVTRRGMSIRIERLLAKQRDVRIHTSLGPAGSAVVALAALGLVAAIVSPSIAYDAVPVAPVDPMAPTIASHVTPQTPVRPKTPVTPSIFAHALVTIPKLSPFPPIGIASVSKQVVAEANAPSYIDELEKVGYTNLSVDDLLKLKTSGVDANFVRAVQRAGGPRLSVEELVELKAVGVDPAYYAAMRVRLGRLSVDDIAGLRSTDVTPAYVDHLAREGYKNLTVDEIEEMRATGVDPSYGDAMKKRFGPSIDEDQVAGLRALGVTPEYVDALRAAGAKNLSVDRVQGFRATGVTPAYIAQLVQAGYANLSDDEIQQMRSLGIDGAYVKRANGHGSRHLSVDELLQLKATGVL